MDFTVVDIPVPGVASHSSPIVQALLENVGKALSLPLGDRNTQTVRKTLRASLVSRGILKTHNFRTRISPDGKTMIVWLELIPTEEKK